MVFFLNFEEAVGDRRAEHQGYGLKGTEISLTSAFKPNATLQCVRAAPVSQSRGPSNLPSSIQSKQNQMLRVRLKNPDNQPALDPLG